MACQVCVVVWDIWGERNEKVFRGLQKSASHVWSLVRFCVSLWDSVPKFFVIIPLVTCY